ncbi:hypothetical protein FCV25MIE_16277 [Fagus crenata]
MVHNIEQHQATDGLVNLLTKPNHDLAMDKEGTRRSVDLERAVSEQNFAVADASIYGHPPHQRF